MAHEIILCVDDDSSVLSALRSLLVKCLNHNQTIEIAESGEEALEIIQEIEREHEELPVIIADYIMPGMKGDELLVQVHNRLPKTMKIMLTGQSDLYGVKRAINEAGLFRFLEKPWHNEDIILTLQAALKTYELDRELQHQNDELRNMNEKLEWIVAERTRELTDKNRELEHLAITDRLTGLHNRLFLDRILANEFASAGRNGTVFSLILMDIDHFKRVNDTYGHHVGDLVLIDVGTILRERVRGSDVAGRWGGEEFLIVCPDTPLDGAIEAAEMLRKLIDDHEFPKVGKRSASFGVASYTPGDTIAAVEARADKALYIAKEKGRNQVVVG